MTLKNPLLWMLNTRKGLSVLQEIAQHAQDMIGLVTSYPERGTQEDCGSQIETYCKAHDIPYLPWKTLKDTLELEITRCTIKGIIAIGWQYLIPRSTWEVLDNGLIIFHDSLLPRYRGFAPLPTAIIQGEPVSGLSVIYAGDRIDDGDIILQEQLFLEPNIYIDEAISRMAFLYRKAVNRLVAIIREGGITRTPQDEAQATYSIWRDLEDCRIDWTQPAAHIYNMIRAVNYPYPGAHSTLGGQLVKIWKAEVAREDVKFELRNPGKIWQLDEGLPVVVCGENLLKLTELTDERRRPILPLKQLRSRFK